MVDTHILNGAELGGATGAMAPLVFWSRSLKKSRKVSKSKSRSLEWHQLFLPSFGADEYDSVCIYKFACRLSMHIAQKCHLQIHQLFEFILQIKESKLASQPR